MDHLTKPESASACVGLTSESRESSEGVSYLELDKWIRHCLIAKRRRQLSADSGSISESPDNGIWDRLFDLRVQVDFNAFGTSSLAQ